MKGTRWKSVIRDCLGNIHRETRISLCRVPHPEKWVFIVGCYNSGTTLLRNILGSHPDICALPSEGQYLTDQFPSDHEIGLSRMWVKREDLYRLTESDTGPDVTRIKKEWGARLNTSKSVLLDQTPANVARMRWLQKYFENSYFVGVIRNGYAVTEGITRKARPTHKPNGWSIEDAAYQWRRSNEIMEEDSRYLDRYSLFRYEDLTKSPNKTVRKILDFLEMRSSTSIDLNRNWSIHERNQGIRNMNNESLERLSKDQVTRINKIISAKMNDLGYEVLP